MVCWRCDGLKQEHVRVCWGDVVRGSLNGPKTDCGAHAAAAGEAEEGETTNRELKGSVLLEGVGGRGTCKENGVRTR